jgi:DNA anti-recombination protein RmuC
MSANPYDVIAEEVRGLGSKIEHMEDCLGQVAGQVSRQEVRLVAVESWQEASNQKIEKFWSLHFPALLKRVEKVDTHVERLDKHLSSQYGEIRAMRNQLSILMIAIGGFLALLVLQ